MAVAKTAYLTTFLAPAVSRKFILKPTPDGFKPDFEGITDALRKYEKGTLPVRFMGFPSYTFFLFQLLDERKLYFKLPKGSKIMLGGGWKQFYQEAADKETFYKLAKKTLGIEDDNIVEFFGAVEHPVLYCDCAAFKLSKLPREKQTLFRIFFNVLWAAPSLIWKMRSFLR